ncbi:MAG: hypothetical protein CMP10_09725 [Zetaproteobacteria bacterium]|nr:hypothetical protein [Pseudobdellovibrionaceae bacterium]
MTRDLHKWLATIRVNWTKHLTWKLNLLLMVIGPAVIFYVVKINLWQSIFEFNELEVFQGYTLGKMLSYQLWVLVVSMLAQGYNSMNLAEDIRLGRISAYLIYPFSFANFHLAGFFAFQGVQIIVAGLTLAVALTSALMPMPELLDLGKGFFISMLVGLVWFQISFVIGLGAFWLEETWVLRVMFLNIASLLSGSILPLEVFPEWLQQGLMYTPFPWLTWFPAKVFMGEAEASIVTAALVLLFWYGVFRYISHLIWSRGLQLYTAAGM